MVMPQEEVEGDRAFKNLLYKLTRIRLDTVHPRAKDRTETLWFGAATIMKSDSLKAAFDKMAENNILCLPVVDSMGKVVGQLTIANLLRWIMRHFDVDPDSTTIAAFFEKRKLLDTALVEAIMDDYEYYTCKGSYSVYRAAETMARQNSKRVIVTSWNDTVIGIFTLSMLIGEIYNNRHLLSTKTKNMKVRDMTKSYYVSRVREDSRTIDAFRIMNDWGRTGLAVTNMDGAIVDELSDKDLNVMVATADSYMRLYSNVKEFKGFVRQDAKIQGKKVPALPQLVTEDSTFDECIIAMDQTPCHRVFVVDNLRNKRPLYVISQTDILRHIFPSLGWW
eukprot:gb/GEZN01011925.1/.p1 GENE.gb/GEZN01011925.1/~~gb/GEZN01011925.1/.p1  ORF type:complete len:335 (+),score=33.91 gb/GEZN01011925.1/:34-1038(+)